MGYIRINAVSLALVACLARTISTARKDLMKEEAGQAGSREAEEAGQAGSREAEEAGQAGSREAGEAGQAGSREAGEAGQAGSQGTGWTVSRAAIASIKLALT